MRRALLALVAFGCTKAGDQPALHAATHCMEAAEAAAHAILSSPDGPPPARIAEVACPALYRRLDCGKAWLAAFGDRAPVDRVIDACAAAYCRDLPAGVRACRGERGREPGDGVSLLGELDQAVLRAEHLDPVSAYKLSRRAELLSVLAVPEKVPRADAGPPAPPLVLTISRDGRIVLGDRPVSEADLTAALRGDATRSIIIRADDQVPHQRVVEIIDAVRAAGFQKASIESETEGAP